MLEVFGMSRSGRRRVGVGRALVLGLVAVAAGATAVVMSNGGRSAAAPVTTTFTYGGAPVAIPDGGDLTGDNPGATVGASVSATGLTGVVTDVNLLIGGSACSASAGATAVGIDHTFINDLHVRLTSPSGTTVTVINEIDGGGNNLCQTLLDDEPAQRRSRGSSPARRPSPARSHRTLRCRRSTVGRRTAPGRCRCRTSSHKTSAASATSR